MYVHNVVSYSCFMFLLAVALSVSSASPSTKSRLSVLTFSLTSLFAAVCFFFAATFAALVRLLLTAPFLSFLICIFLIVSAEIQSLCCGFLLPSTSSQVVFTASYSGSIACRCLPPHLHHTTLGGPWIYCSI